MVPIVGPGRARKISQSTKVPIYILKVKVNFTLKHEMKAQRGEQRYSSTRSLTSTLEGGGWSTPRTGSFTPRKDPVPNVGPRAGLDGHGKSRPHGYSIAGQHSP